MPKTGKRSPAIWYCEECAPNEVKGSEPCGACCGYRISTSMDDLTTAQRDALADLFRQREETNVAWGPSDVVDKRSLYALERRGLVVRNGYQAVTKLTPAGINLAKMWASR